MFLILISYWIGIFLVAAGITATSNPDSESIAVIVIGLGAIVQSIILLISKM